MNYFRCKACWRVYDRWQLTDGPYDRCNCGSFRFKGSDNKFVHRLLTDFKYTFLTWIRERLNHEKRS